VRSVWRRGRTAAFPRPAALAVVTLSLAAVAPAWGICDGTIFRDGFETGDTSAWSNSPAAPRADGAWRLVIDFDGTPRAFALDLVERADGSLVGYLLGGTSQGTMVTGSESGGAVAMTLELASPGGTRTIQLDGTLARDAMSLTASGGVATQAVSGARLSCGLVERQLLAAAFSGPDPVHVRELAAVLDDEGAFVAGGYVGQEDCDLWGCDGGLTSFSEAGDQLEIGLETDGGCSAGSALTATWDPASGVYMGSYVFHDCSGTSSGAAGAALSMATTSAAAHDLMAGRAEIADRLEAGAPIPDPLAGFAPGYLHFGKDEPEIRAELEAEMALYSDIQVDLGRARDLATEVQARTLPDLVRPFGWTIDERRRGVPAGGGPGPVTYRDTATRPLIDDYGVVAEVGGRWRIVGNQVPGLDLPFDYSIPAGSSRLEAPTADGHPVYVSVGPYGAHFQPLTGDPSGEGKANFVGFLVSGDEEMEELVGNGDGHRDPGEVWGYPIGGDPTGDRVRNRRPVYRPPIDATIETVIYEHGPTGVYFDDEPAWRVGLRLPGQVGLELGHVGRIAPTLRALVLAATGIDTDTFAGPDGTDLLAGHPAIPVAAGTDLALPQILAPPVPGFPGYYLGGGSFVDYPWAQMEFQVSYHLADRSGGDFCVYRFFTADRRAGLQAAMDLDMLDPGSLRYRDSPWTRRWQWTAQGSLCQAESPLPEDFSSLDTRLGGWYERPAAGTTPDELFSWVRLDRDSAVYDPANYDSPAVDHLVIRFLWPGPYSWPMPDGTTAFVYEAVGEALDWDDSSILVKWRELNATNPEVYQRVAYRLDASGLEAKWGNLAATPGGAIQPTLLPGDPCNDTDTLCYDHSLGAWPP
jgi:hypothetical protein